MDLNTYKLEDLLLSAIKAEHESYGIYSKLAKSVKNFLLSERLNFLAHEEKKHKEFFEWIYSKNFGDKTITLPDKTIVPLPEITGDLSTTPISEILSQAMNAEKAAHDFYMSLTDKFKNSTDIPKMLEYIAAMEMGHYKILEVEKDIADRFEYFDMEWPMLHVGP